MKSHQLQKFVEVRPEQGRPDQGRPEYSPFGLRIAFSLLVWFEVVLLFSLSNGLFPVLHRIPPRSALPRSQLLIFDLKHVTLAEGFFFQKFAERKNIFAIASGFMDKYNMLVDPPRCLVSSCPGSLLHSGPHVVHRWWYQEVGLEHWNLPKPFFLACNH